MKKQQAYELRDRLLEKSSTDPRLGEKPFIFMGDAITVLMSFIGDQEPALNKDKILAWVKACDKSKTHFNGYDVPIRLFEKFLTAHEQEVEITFSCPDKRAYDRYVLDCQGEGLEPLSFDDWKEKFDKIPDTTHEQETDNKKHICYTCKQWSEQTGWCNFHRLVTYPEDDCRYWESKENK